MFNVLYPTTFDDSTSPNPTAAQSAADAAIISFFIFVFTFPGTRSGSVSKTSNSSA